MMYANLKVNVSGPDAAPSGEELYAWEIVVRGDRATVKIDAQDGTGSYAEEAGERVFDLSTHELTIAADF